MSTIRLFYIRWDDGDGVNRDLLVEAKTATDAIGFWRLEYELDPKQMPEYAGEIKLTGQPGVIHWVDVIPKFT